MLKKHKHMVEKLREQITARISQRFNLVNREPELSRFSTYDKVALFEYRTGLGQSVTVGISKRRGESQEINILLFSPNQTISAIRENIVDYTKHPKKAFNPIVFSVNIEEQIHWLRIHPDRGSYVNGVLLTGPFKEIFDQIVSAVHYVHAQETFTIGSLTVPLN